MNRRTAKSENQLLQFLVVSFPFFNFSDSSPPLEMFEMFFLVQSSPGGPSDVKKIPKIRIFVTIYQDQLPLETESPEDSTLKRRVSAAGPAYVVANDNPVNPGKVNVLRIIHIFITQANIAGVGGSSR